MADRPLPPCNKTAKFQPNLNQIQSLHQNNFELPVNTVTSTEDIRYVLAVSLSAWKLGQLSMNWFGNNLYVSALIIHVSSVH